MKALVKIYIKRLSYDEESKKWSCWNGDVVDTEFEVSSREELLKILKKQLAHVEHYEGDEGEPCKDVPTDIEFSLGDCECCKTRKWEEYIKPIKKAA